MTHYEIIKKLIGPINPVGESNEDQRRIVNLIATIDLVELLINDLKQASKGSERYEYSMKQIGQLAKQALTEIKHNID